uniref:Uncharacterized protein n=1 Tax=Candidatus Kentrum sp. FM TaxID=2126340 RepID=A0A450TUB1_9GAMM
MKEIRDGIVDLGNARLHIPFLSLDSPCTYITGPNIGARDFYRLISISYVSVINKIFTIT